MPLGARILVHLPEAPSETLLRELGTQLQSDLEIEVGDFYDAPLKLLADADGEEAPFVDENSVWLELQLKADFYGPCYERGDIELYVRCAEWLEKCLPDCTVYYGTDCAADATPFNSQLRAKYLRYYEKIGGSYRIGRSEQEHANLWEIWESC